MCPDAVWQAFSQTGDPLYYLLYKSLQQLDRAQTDRGEAPSAGD